MASQRRGGQVRQGFARDLDFENFADPVEIDDFADAHAANDVAGALLAPHQAFLFEARQRLLDRRAADLELVRDAQRAQPLPRLIDAVDNGLFEAVIGLVQDAAPAPRFCMHSEFTMPSLLQCQEEDFSANIDGCRRAQPSCDASERRSLAIAGTANGYPGRRSIGT